MTEESFEGHMAEMLADTCRAAISRIPNLIRNETVYGVALCTAPEFNGFALAINTEESLARKRIEHSGMHEKLTKMLEDHPDLLAMWEAHEEPEDYLRVVADEWGYMDIAPDTFKTANEWIIDQYVKRTDTSQPLDSKSKLGICETALRSVRDSSSFTADHFANDVLLCVQYSEMSNDEPDLLELATNLNSADWNEKLRTVWGGGNRSKNDNRNRPDGDNFDSN